MDKMKFKKSLVSALSLMMVAATLTPASAQETVNLDTLKSEAKDYWDFESETPLTSNKNTVATKNGAVEVKASSNQNMGKSLYFGQGLNNYMKVDSYINTGANQTTFAMWYRYDSKLDTGDAKSKPAVLLQHEDNGKSLLTLKPNGNLHTFVNGQDVLSNGTTKRDEWEHVAVTFDQAKKKVSFYINGELDSTKDLTGTPTTGNLALRLGAHKTKDMADPHPMRGEVDEFYVYEKALTADQIKALYEDKGKALFFEEDLQGLITSSEKTLENGSLAEDHELAVALKAAIDTAKACKDKTLAEMKAAYTALKTAKDAYLEVTPVVLTVNPENIIQTIDADSIFGINHRYSLNGYGTFDSETMQAKEEFKKLYDEVGFGSIRYPGGTISNLFNWKTTLGPKEARKKQIHGFYNNAGQGGIVPNLGIKEIGDFADSVNSELVYVYSLGRGSAQDAADLVEFLNAKVGTNPNGGVDWAKVRSDLGRPEPYNVRYFEIGNEMQQAWTGDGTTSQGYWTLYTRNNTEKAYTEGGTMSVVKMYAVDEEDWNMKASQTTGKPGLVRYLRYSNQNPGMLDEATGKVVPDPKHKAMEPGVKVFVGTKDNNVEWKVVENFDNSKATDKHVVVDYSLGTITFGDGVHGKVPDAGQNVFATYSVKHDGFLQVSKAIKDTTATINEKENKNHEANVYSSYESHGFIQRMKDLGKNDLYDGLTIHPYSTTPISDAGDEAFYDSAMKLAEDKGIGNVTKLVADMPAGKVPVISEYGIYNSTNPLVRSQTHAVYIAKVLMEYVKLGSPYIQKHCLSDWYSTGGDSLGPTQQAVIQVVPQADGDKTTGEGTFKYFSTPSARVFQMFNAGFGDDVYEATFNADQPTLANGAKALNSLVSKDKDGNVYVALVNVDREKNYNIQLNGLDLAGREMEVQHLETDSFKVENDLENPNRVAVETETTVMPEDQTINVKKHSVVLIKVLADKPAPEVDKTELDAAIVEAEGYDAKLYTAESYAALTAALEAAAALGEDASQAEVDACTKAINDAIAGLVLADKPAPEVDRTKLEEAITKAEDFDVELYTAESYAALTAALEAAAALGEGASQAEVDACVKAINDAIAGLVAINPDKEVDKSFLADLIKVCEAIDPKEVTEESYKKLSDALVAAKSVLASDKVTQAQVDAAYVALSDALEALEKVTPSKPSDPTKPDAQDKPDTGDATNIVGLFAMASLALAGVYVTTRRRKED